LAQEVFGFAAKRLEIIAQAFRPVRV
jgi:hypothetical protein